MNKLLLVKRYIYKGLRDYSEKNDCKVLVIANGQLVADGLLRRDGMDAWVRGFIAGAEYLGLEWTLEEETKFEEI